jgi:multicomponent Na+:H+ antiporter subunit F
MALNILAIITSLIILVVVILLLITKEFLQKILVFGVLSNLAMLFIVILGSYKYNESYIDIAIIYILLSFIVNKAILQFVILRKNG